MNAAPRPCEGGCGRRLTDPASLRRGYGPVCWAKTHHTPAAAHLPDLTPMPATTGQLALEEITVTDRLPHDEYIGAVAAALADCGVLPGSYWTETPDGEQLDAVLTDFPSDQIDRDEWPHGVYLGWDQHRGWLLIEQGGGRNVHALDPGGVRTFSSPRQVAVSTANALHGHPTGPICERPWDSRSLEAAIKDWQDATD